MYFQRTAIATNWKINEGEERERCMASDAAAGVNSEVLRLSAVGRAGYARGCSPVIASARPPSGKV